MKTLVSLIPSVRVGFSIAQFVPRTIAADNLKISGESGVLLDYDVIVNGEQVCSDSDVSVKLQTIERE